MFFLSTWVFAQSGPNTGEIPSSAPLSETSTTSAPDQDPNMAPPKTEPPAPSASAPKVIVPKTPLNGVVSITKIVGEVGDQFITSREVKIYNAVEQALDANAAATSSSLKILTGQERAFPSEVMNVLDERAVYFEARSLGSADVPKAATAKAVAAVEEKWANNPSWKDLEVGADELRTIIEIKLSSKEFEKLKSDPALSPVSDDEALSYYKKNRLRFGSLPYSSFEQNIKAYLVKNQIEKRLTEWHDVLRRKYKTRNFIAG